jgi:hypothetical protein
MLTCQNLSSRDLLVSTKVPTIAIIFVPELRLLLTFSRTVETKASAARRHPTQPGSHQYTAHRKYQTPSLLQHTDTFFQHRKLFDSSFHLCRRLVATTRQRTLQRSLSSNNEDLSPIVFAIKASSLTRKHFHHCMSSPSTGQQQLGKFG